MITAFSLQSCVRNSIGRGLAVAALLMPVSLFAQPSSAEASDAPSGADRKANAEALFEEAVSLADSGQLEAACAKFEASESLDAAVGTLLHLADCYERIGRLASAWARFREARSLAGAQSMPDRERIARMRADALEPKLARVTIVAPARAPPGFSIRIGDTPVPRASWGSALPFDPGQLMLEASAPGHVTFRQRLNVPATDAARVTVKVPALRAARSAAASKGSRPAVSDPGQAARTIGITAAVVGGLGLAGSGVLTVLATRRNDESLKNCPESPRLCSASGVEKRNEAGRFADLATVSAAVGGGLVATGLVLYATAPSRRPRERVSIGLAPDFSTRGLSLRAKGAF